MNTKDIIKEIREAKEDQETLIKRFDLGKPYHAIDVWEICNVAEAKLSQRLSDCKEELKFLENLDDEMSMPPDILTERITYLKSEVKKAKELK